MSSSLSSEQQPSMALSLPLHGGVYPGYSPKVSCSMSFWASNRCHLNFRGAGDPSERTPQSAGLMHRPSTSREAKGENSMIFHAAPPPLPLGLFPMSPSHHRYLPSNAIHAALFPGDLCPSYPPIPPVFSSGLPIMPRASYPSYSPFIKPSSSSNRGRYDTLSPYDSSPEGPKNCHICGKTYARLSTLRLHLRTHSGVKPYQCMVCLKSFTQAANLTAHFRIHSGEKPFKCRVCERQFSQSSSVTTHMRTHNGERPYKCKVCSKAFADSSTLTKHVRTHTGEKPYQCEICLQRFSQSGNMNRHKRIHNEI